MKQYPLSGQDTTTNRWKSAALSILKNRKKITTGNYNNNPQRHRFQERPTSIGSAHQFCRFDDQDFICHACGTDADQSNDSAAVT
uniref:Uncharacterized protein n=1 Tax=Romanomermis culicivorax TaxID=13658 RepID=A0A915ITX5_ROMCU